MKTKLTALFLVLILLCSWNLPVIAQAAETEPMVLQSKKQNSTLTNYYYDEKGNCVREESAEKGTAYEYIYNDANTIVQEKYYQKNRLSYQKDYDSRGDLITYWNTDKDSNLQKAAETNYVYDTYGRKLLQEITSLTFGDKEVTQYSYNNPPKTLIFGHYEQDGNPKNGQEPIEWIILDTDGEYTLVVSKYGLDSRHYEKSGAGVSWNESDVRQFLNREFLLFAFSFSEIMNCFKPVQFEKTIGKDNIFLLSLDEVNKYFSSDAERICTPTAYAINNKAQTDEKTEASWWALRNAGSTDTLVAQVNADGSVDSKCISVSEVGGAVRPALWVKTSAITYGSQMPNRIDYNVYYTDPDTIEIKYNISQTETYDDSGRLTSRQDHVTGESEYISYDAHGNVISQRTSTISHNYETSTNRTSEHTYDKDGRLTKTNVRYDHTEKSFEEKYEGSDSSSTVITYSYDADDRLIRRVSKDDDGSVQTEEWTYDKDGRLIAEASTSDSAVTITVWTYANDGSSTCQISEHYGKHTSTEVLEYDVYGNLLKRSKNGTLVEENVYVPLSQAQWKD